MNLKRTIYLLPLVVFGFSFGCSSPKASDPTTSKPASTPTPTPAPKQQQVDPKEKSVEAAQRKAITDFVGKNYEGWSIAGIATGYDKPACIIDTPCRLNLSKDGKDKVVTVVLREYIKLDGSSYWLVTLADPLDFLQARVESLKEEIRGEVLANLTSEDCESFVENDRDSSDDGADRHTDPRD